MQTPDQQRVAEMVRAEMAERRWNPRDLARATKADPGTIGDFLNFKRWPKLGTQGKIEAALEWTAGEMDRLAREGGTPSPAAGTGDVGAVGDSGTEILLHLPPAALEGLTEMEREEITAAGRIAILRALREIRGS